MKRRTGVRFLLVSVVTAASGLLSGCSGGTSSNASAAPPTAPTPTTSLNLAGSWSGTLGDPVDPDPDRLAWTAAQSGATATGTAVLTMSRPPGETGPPRTVTGSMTAALAGTQATFTFTLPAGVFAPLGGPAACSVRGTATATATDTSITATMTRTFDQSCVGSVGKGTSDTVRLSLTKQ